MITEWEKINNSTERLRVHGGWLVHRIITVRSLVSISVTSSMVFIPGAIKEWKLPEKS